MSSEFEQVGQRLIKRAEHTIRQCDEALRDMQHWNATHSDQRPVTADDVPGLVANKVRAQRLIRAVRNGEPIQEQP
jgi:hypothetical protein